VINKLINLANALDEAGFKKEAGEIDALINKQSMIQVLANPYTLVFIAFSLAIVSVPTETWEELARRLIETMRRSKPSPSPYPDNDPYTESQREALRHLEHGLEKLIAEELARPRPEGEGDGDDVEMLRKVLDKVKEALRWRGDGPMPIPIPDGRDDTPDDYDGEGPFVSCFAIHENYKWMESGTGETYYFYYNTVLNEDFIDSVCKFISRPRKDIRDLNNEFFSSNSYHNMHFIGEISDNPSLPQAHGRHPNGKYQQKRIIAWAREIYGAHINVVTVYDFSQKHKCRWNTKHDSDKSSLGVYYSSTPDIKFATDYSADIIKGFPTPSGL